LAAGLPHEGPTGSCLRDLEGSLSGNRYSADELIGLDPADGKPLLARYDLETAARSLNQGALAGRLGSRLWRWQELLPVRDWPHVVSLGEGGCPLLPAPRLGASLGLRDLQVKAESLNPTGSFKARGMAVAVSRAVELGARHLVAPSAGNAGGALAAYAARAGVHATVVMPADAPAANQVEVLAAGATLLLLDGLISDCGRLAARLAKELGAFDLSTLREPYRVEGKKTMGFELAEDLGWELPDAVIYPTGGGTGLIGIWKAFDELERMGLIGSRRPRLVSVQAEGCAPIVRAFATGERFAEPWAGARTAAAGLRVPGAVGDFLMLDAIRASGGTAVAVPEMEIVAMQKLVSARTGLFVGLETGAAAAAIPHLLASGGLSAGERVVLFDTGSGFKSAPPDFSPPRPIENREESWAAAVEAVRRAAG
jgi:threonine synthase